MPHWRPELCLREVPLKFPARRKSQLPFCRDRKFLASSSALTSSMYPHKLSDCAMTSAAAFFLFKQNRSSILLEQNLATNFRRAIILFKQNLPSQITGAGLVILCDLLL